MDDLTKIISTLEQRGPVVEAHFYEAQGPATWDQLMRAAFAHISGEDGNSYYYHVLERCGCHPEEAMSQSKVDAYETARKLLIQSPKSRAEMDALLEKSGL